MFFTFFSALLLVNLLIDNNHLRKFRKKGKKEMLFDINHLKNNYKHTYGKSTEFLVNSRDVESWERVLPPKYVGFYVFYIFLVFGSSVVGSFVHFKLALKFSGTVRLTTDRVYYLFDLLVFINFLSCRCSCSWVKTEAITCTFRNVESRTWHSFSCVFVHLL